MPAPHIVLIVMTSRPPSSENEPMKFVNIGWGVFFSRWGISKLQKNWAIWIEIESYRHSSWQGLLR